MGETTGIGSELTRAEREERKEANRRALKVPVGCRLCEQEGEPLCCIHIAIADELARALAARRLVLPSEAAVEAALRAVPRVCRLCKCGFPIVEGSLYQWHIASQSLGMIAETKCEARDPDYPALARAVRALLGGKTR